MDPNYQQPNVPQQPQTPFPPSQESQAPHDPYGFIMNAENQPKRKLGGGGNSTKSRLLLVLGVGMVIIFAIIIVSSLLNGGSNKNTSILSDLVAEQSEILRVTELGLKGSKNPDTLAYAQTTKLSITAERSKLLGYLATKKVKLTPIQFNAKLNKEIDLSLTSAAASNQFDEVFMAALKQSLKAYATEVRTGYNNASNPTSKAILKDSFTSTSVLLK